MLYILVLCSLAKPHNSGCFAPDIETSCVHLTVRVCGKRMDLVNYIKYTPQWAARICGHLDVDTVTRIHMCAFVRVVCLVVYVPTNIIADTH